MVAKEDIRVSKCIDDLIVQLLGILVRRQIRLKGRCTYRYVIGLRDVRKLLDESFCLGLGRIGGIVDGDRTSFAGKCSRCSRAYSSSVDRPRTY